MELEVGDAEELGLVIRGEEILYNAKEEQPAVVQTTRLKHGLLDPVDNAA